MTQSEYEPNARVLLKARVIEQCSNGNYYVEIDESACEIVAPAAIIDDTPLSTAVQQRQGEIIASHGRRIEEYDERLAVLEKNVFLDPVSNTKRRAEADELTALREQIAELTTRVNAWEGKTGSHKWHYVIDNVALRERSDKLEAVVQTGQAILEGIPDWRTWPFSAEMRAHFEAIEALNK